MRVAQVKDLVIPSLLLDHADICRGVIGSHLSPVILPVLFIVLGERGVLLRILSSAVVAKPDVKALVIERQRQWVAFDV